MTDEEYLVYEAVVAFVIAIQIDIIIFIYDYRTTSLQTHDASGARTDNRDARPYYTYSITAVIYWTGRDRNKPYVTLLSYASNISNCKR